MLTKLNNKAVANVTSIPVALGDMVLVSSATASSSASIEFSLGNYKEYQFYFVDMHPSNDGVSFGFNGSTDNGSNYNVTKTSTFFEAYQNESGSASSLNYQDGYDLAQSTSYQTMAYAVGGNSDENCSGYLNIFNPASTVYVKHFISRFSTYNSGDYMVDNYSAGYANTTSALTNIKFQMSSGNIDAGKILMFGVN